MIGHVAVETIDLPRRSGKISWAIPNNTYLQTNTMFLNKYYSAYACVQMDKYIYMQ